MKGTRTMLARVSLLVRASPFVLASTFVLPSLFVLACGGEATPDPALDRARLVSEEPSVASTVTAMLQAYGGVAAWTGHQNVEYRYRLQFFGGQKEPLRVSTQKHRLGLADSVQVYIEDLDGGAPQIARLDGETFSLTQGGAPVADPSQVAFRQSYGRIVRWAFLTPWNLLDTGSTLTSRGVRTPQPAGPVPPGPCDVVRLRFERVTDGGSTDDWHDFYISRRSHLVEQIHSYRSEPNDFRLVVWSDHRDFDGIRVATRRATYASDASGAVGQLEAVVEYSDVRFDAPFDKDVFRAGETSLSAAQEPASQEPVSQEQASDR